MFHSGKKKYTYSEGKEKIMINSKYSNMQRKNIKEIIKNESR
jgi:hypothetical protein